MLSWQPCIPSIFAVIPLLLGDSDTINQSNVQNFSAYIKAIIVIIIIIIIIIAIIIIIIITIIIIIIIIIIVKFMIII